MVATVEARSQNVQYQQKKTGGTGKAIASAFIPGLGQFIDGRNGAGAAYLGGALAIGGTSIALQRSITKDMFESLGKAEKSGIGPLKTIPKGKAFGVVALGLSGIALLITNIVDAYRGNRK